MLSVNHIQKLFENRDYDRLIDCLANNGAALPLPLQARLAQPASAVGLGLRRLCELTYGSTCLRQAMTGDLLSYQLPDGTFRGSVDRDPLTTAAAAAGLAAVLREQTIPDTHLADALEQALAALAGNQDAEGLFRHSDDRTVQDRALTSAFVLFLLARLPRFRETVRFADLMNWFDERADRLDDETVQLYHMASLDDPARVSTDPLLTH